MFHKVRTVTAIEDFKLIVEFCEGITKEYDVKPWFERQPVFINLKKNNLFDKVNVDFGGIGICWNSEIDLECDELYYFGITIKSKFDGLFPWRQWFANTATQSNSCYLRKILFFNII